MSVGKIVSFFMLLGPVESWRGTRKGRHVAEMISSKLLVEVSSMQFLCSVLSDVLCFE